jgi:DNA processing protein
VTRRAGNDERFALAALTWIGEPGDARLAAMVRVDGPVKALDLIRAGRLPSAPKTRRILGRWRAAAGRVPGRADLAAVFHSGMRLICPGDSEWPAGLAALGEAAPLALWARGSGDLAEACARSVAITGTRACTAFGSQAAETLAEAVSGRGWAVVSGGAFGIDTAAHRGAIGAGRSTVAVLAGGLEHPYPCGHRWLMEAVAERGVLVSEHPPGRRATRARFLARNRVITALACGTVIAETLPRSSALEAAQVCPEPRAAGHGRAGLHRRRLVIGMPRADPRRARRPGHQRRGDHRDHHLRPARSSGRARPERRR